MTVQLYFDRPVTGVDDLIFSSRSHISVYAELGAICSDFREELGGRSMVELVVAPAAEWFKLDDATLISRVMEEFTVPPPSGEAGNPRQEHRRAHPSIRLSRTPGMDRYRPDQATVVPNFFLCGDYTQQDYLASMEGAVLSGKQAAQRIAASSLKAFNSKLTTMNQHHPPPVTISLTLNPLPSSMHVGGASARLPHPSHHRRFAHPAPGPQRRLRRCARPLHSPCPEAEPRPSSGLPRMRRVSFAGTPRASISAPAFYRPASATKSWPSTHSAG